MIITAKNIQRSNIILVYADGTLKQPDAAQVFGLYQGNDARGSTFSDTPSLATRVFEFPVPGLQIIFEPNKIRIEDKLGRSPKESHLVNELYRLINSLYKEVKPIAYGFNYDIIYRVDQVIPIKDIMSNFLKQVTIESLKDFGWQYTLNKEKGKRAETYFFKSISPIEYGVHANFHFNDQHLPKPDTLQMAFEKRYSDTDESVLDIKF